MCVCVCVCVCVRVKNIKEYCHPVLGLSKVRGTLWKKNELYVSQSINIHFLENNIVLV